jgi:uncharacterized membrane protein
MWRINYFLKCNASLYKIFWFKMQLKERTMKRNLRFLISCAVTTAVSMACVPSANAAADEIEKCYGIVKSGMNDCAAGSHSCAGATFKDGDANEWIFVPKGTCKKIVGGTSK